MNYFERLKGEKRELEQRIRSLSMFINIAPKYKELSVKHKRLLFLQLEFMTAYSLILEMRIEDIENGENND